MQQRPALSRSYSPVDPEWFLLPLRRVRVVISGPSWREPEVTQVTNDHQDAGDVGRRITERQHELHLTCGQVAERAGMAAQLPRIPRANANGRTVALNARTHRARS